MKLILASTSPRRKQLLADAGFIFDCATPTAEESRRSKETPRAMVLRLALEKCQSIGERLVDADPSLVIGSDTTVVTPRGNHILEKPQNPADGMRMLRLLSGRTHTVLTAVCLQEWSRGKIRRSRRFVVSTKVRFRTLTKQEILDYAHSGEPKDKAGSYAAQGRGLSFIQEVRGSYSSVIGFPVAHFIEEMRKHWKDWLIATKR